MKKKKKKPTPELFAQCANSITLVLCVCGSYKPCKDCHKAPNYLNSDHGASLSIKRRKKLNSQNTIFLGGKKG